MKKKLMRGICLFIILLMAGCGNPGGEAENSQGDSASLNMVSVNISADMASENQAEDTSGGNEDHNILGEGETIELSNGLYAYLATEVPKDIEINGITEWIVIQDENPENGTYYNVRWENLSLSAHGNWILIPNVYGNIIDIRTDDYSKIYICYEDEEMEIEQVTIPLDFYASEGNVVEPVYGWEPVKVLCYNREELTNEILLPAEVWSEAFTSEGKEYMAVYSRISPMYSADYSEGAYIQADYQFTICQGDEILYEVKLYQMLVKYEEVHYIEDINGDGVRDFIQMSGTGFSNPLGSYPYIFVWDPEQKTCISGGMIAPEEKATYELQNGIAVSPIYGAVRYDRDNRTFYDVYNIERHDHYDNDIHGKVIVCGARYIDGEWKTVYELYLGEEGADYVWETKYDEEGNVISQIICTEEDHYDLVRNIYDECEMKLYEDMDYHSEEIVVNEQFSYLKYVRNEE